MLEKKVEIEFEQWELDIIVRWFEITEGEYGVNRLEDGVRSKIGDACKVLRDSERNDPE